MNAGRGSNGQSTADMAPRKRESLSPTRTRTDRPLAVKVLDPPTRTDDGPIADTAANDVTPLFPPLADYRDR